MQYNKMKENMRARAPLKCIGEAIIQKKFNLIFLLRSCFGFFSAFFCVSSKFFFSFFVREKKGGHTMSTHNTQFTFTRCRSICWFFMIFFFYFNECAGLFLLVCYLQIKLYVQDTLSEWFLLPSWKEKSLPST